MPQQIINFNAYAKLAHQALAQTDPTIAEDTCIKHWTVKIVAALTSSATAQAKGRHADYTSYEAALRMGEDTPQWREHAYRGFLKGTVEMRLARAALLICAFMEARGVTLHDMDLMCVNTFNPNRGDDFTEDIYELSACMFTTTNEDARQLELLKLHEREPDAESTALVADLPEEMRTVRDYENLFRKPKPETELARTMVRRGKAA